MSQSSKKYDSIKTSRNSEPRMSEMYRFTTNLFTSRERYDQDTKSVKMVFQNNNKNQQIKNNGMSELKMTKQINNKVQTVQDNFNWLTHYFCQWYTGNRSEMIKQILVQNKTKFSKAIVFTEKQNIELQNLLQKSNIQFVVINQTHSTTQRQGKVAQFTIPECQVLITNLSQFNNGIIDIQQVNLIINQRLIEDPQKYKRRLLRSKKFDSRFKGAVISLIWLSGIQQNRNCYQMCQKLQKQLKIDFQQYILKRTQLSIGLVIRLMNSAKQLQFTNKLKQSIIQNQDQHIIKITQQLSKINKQMCSIKGNVKNFDIISNNIINIPKQTAQIIQIQVIKPSQEIIVKTINENQKNVTNSIKAVQNEMIKNIKDGILVINQMEEKIKKQLKSSLESTETRESKQAVQGRKQLEQNYDSILTKITSIQSQLKTQTQTSSSQQSTIKKHLTQFLTKIEKLYSNSIAKAQKQKNEEQIKQQKIIQKQSQQKLQAMNKLQEQHKKQLSVMKLMINEVVRNQQIFMKNYSVQQEQRKKKQEMLIWGDQRKYKQNQMKKKEIKQKDLKINQMQAQLENKNKQIKQLQKIIEQKQKNHEISTRAIRSLTYTSVSSKKGASSFIDQDELEISRQLLNNSQLFTSLPDLKKQFLCKSILSMKGFSDLHITRTKKLFEKGQKSTEDSFLSSIAGKRNLLMIAELENKHLIAAFSQDPYMRKKGQVYSGDAFLLSITNSKMYKLKPRFHGKGIMNEEYVLIFGNNELSLFDHNNKYSVIFGKPHGHFDANGVKIEQFIGSVEDEGNYLKLEFHQVFVERLT